MEGVRASQQCQGLKKNTWKVILQLSFFAFWTRQYLRVLQIVKILKFLEPIPLDSIHSIQLPHSPQKRLGDFKFQPEIRTKIFTQKAPNDAVVVTFASSPVSPLQTGAFRKPLVGWKRRKTADVGGNWIRKVPFLLGNWIAGCRGKVDGN